MWLKKWVQFTNCGGGEFPNWTTGTPDLFPIFNIL
jgi:hypothetical protein